MGSRQVTAVCTAVVSCICWQIALAGNSVVNFMIDVMPALIFQCTAAWPRSIRWPRTKCRCAHQLCLEQIKPKATCGP